MIFATFHKRLLIESRGVIFVHDFNNLFYFGVKKVIVRYEIDYKVQFNKIPILNKSGTLIKKC